VKRNILFLGPILMGSDWASFGAFQTMRVLNSGEGKESKSARPDLVLEKKAVPVVDFTWK